MAVYHTHINILLQAFVLFFFSDKYRSFTENVTQKLYANMHNSSFNSLKVFISDFFYKLFHYLEFYYYYFFYKDLRIIFEQHCNEDIQIHNILSYDARNTPK